MNNIAIGLILSYAFSVLVYFSFIKDGEKNLKSSNKSNDIVISVIVALLVRMVLAYITTGYNTDMGCFRAWSNMMAENGAWGFYVEDVFCDYPPGYMYVLWIIGFINKIFGNMSLQLSTLIVKLPAILCDGAMGILLYYVGKEHFKNNAYATAIAAMYLFNPAIIVNSAVWGQVDAVFALVLIISIYFLAEEKYKKSAALFAVAILIKPQALMFTPIFLFAFIEKIVTAKNKKEWWI